MRIVRKKMNGDYALSSVPSIGLPVEANAIKIEPVDVCAVKIKPTEVCAVKVEAMEGVASGDALIGSRGMRVAVSTSLTELHEDALLEILSRLSYEEVARLRLVCRYFNDVCQKSLNKGFLSVQRYHNRCLKEMKAKLPRRESERRTHPLARHIDVLTGIETRLSLLSMTYYKYIVLGVFCFIPGKVLDECYRVLREVIVHKNPPKSYELLQELRDISSMAMEHFEEHIVPTMKKSQMLSGTLRVSSSSNSIQIQSGLGTGSSNSATNSPRFLRSLTDTDDADLAEQLAASGSGHSSSCPVQQALSTPARGLLARTPAAVLQSVPKLDFVVQQNRILIGNQRKTICELKLKVLEHGRKITEQDRLLNEYGRKIIQLEQKLNAGFTAAGAPAVAVVPQTTVKLNVTDVRGKKRSARVVEDPLATKDNEPVGKRKTATKKSVITCSMSLRNRRN